MKRYQIIVVNTQTGEQAKTSHLYSNKSQAISFVDLWRAQGEPFGAQVYDTKTKKIIY